MPEEIDVKEAEKQLENPYETTAPEDSQKRQVSRVYALIVELDGSAFVAPIEAYLGGGTFADGSPNHGVVPVNDSSMDLPVIRRALLDCLEDVRTALMQSMLLPTVFNALKMKEQEEAVRRVEAQLLKQGAGGQQTKGGLHIPGVG